MTPTRLMSANDRAARSSHWRWVLAGVVLAAMAGPGHSQTTRRVLESEEAARWRAVGSLNVLGAEACTAILISPDEIITAAHCAIEGLTGGLRPVGLYRVNLGQISDGSGSDYGIAASAVLPGYLVSEGGNTVEKIGNDLALMRLAKPVAPEDVVPMTVADWPNPIGEFVDILGYERGGPSAVTIREGCMVLDSQDGVNIANCSVISGLSGGAMVLSRAAEEPPTLVAVVSSSGHGTAYAVTIAPHLAALRAELAK